MDRRTYLRSLGVGTVAVAGCLTGGDRDGSDDGDGTGDDVGLAVQTRYPLFSAAYYSLTGSLAEESDGEPVPFGELPRQARIEVANAVSRDRYVTDGPVSVLDTDVHHDAVSYGGSPVTVAVAVADRFREPEHGPEGDPDWRDPVSVDASVTDGELVVALANELERPLAVHHYGRPYFGVLTAVDDASVHLPHDRYAENEFVREGDVYRTERVRGSSLRSETLSPGEELSETYGLPASVPDGSTVWLSAPIGDESVDLFGNRRTVVAASITVRR